MPCFERETSCINVHVYVYLMHKFIDTHIHALKIRRLLRAYVYATRVLILHIGLNYKSRYIPTLTPERITIRTYTHTTELLS
jgi:hypothetical protein